MKIYRLFLFILISLGFSHAAQAQVQLSGYFVADKACPAYQSIRKQSNPGNISLTTGKSYEVIAKNADKATHYLIKMEAQPNQRWVAIECGQLSTAGEAADKKAAQAHYVLAVSWQPAFCELRSKTKECKSQTENRFDASHFTLHGLWPQPRSNAYCNVDAKLKGLDKDKQWHKLPALKLNTETRQALEKVMPGTQSYLHRHEWIKHGTCYNNHSEDSYYQHSLKLMDMLNKSAVRTVFADNIGKEISAEQIIAAFDKAFGDNAGTKIKIACKQDDKRRLITEITIGLKGDLAKADMKTAMAAAPKANNSGCNKGIVDAVGLQ